MSAELLSTVVSSLLFLGAPLIPLLLLAIHVGDWHEAHSDPEFAEESEGHGHSR
jgi:hypothetical protein